MSSHFTAALDAAETAEDFICAVADVTLPGERENPLLVDVSAEYEQTIEAARRFQRPIDSDICRLLDALASIRDLQTHGDTWIVVVRLMRDIAANAIREHNRTGKESA